MSNVWKNYGDVNFTTWGGCLVKPHWTKEELSKLEDGGESIKHCYDVFLLNTEAGENADQLYALLYMVDLTDLDKENLSDILYAIGEEDKVDLSLSELIEKMGAERLAKEAVEILAGGAGTAVSYRNQYPSSWKDGVLSKEELIDWMTSMGAAEFIGDLAEEE